jgi:hypothetical protein
VWSSRAALAPAAAARLLVCPAVTSAPAQIPRITSPGNVALAGTIMTGSHSSGEVVQPLAQCWCSRRTAVHIRMRKACRIFVADPVEADRSELDPAHGHRSWSVLRPGANFSRRGNARPVRDVPACDFDHEVNEVFHGREQIAISVAVSLIL